MDFQSRSVTIRYYQNDIDEDQVIKYGSFLSTIELNIWHKLSIWDVQMLYTRDTHFDADDDFQIHIRDVNVKYALDK